jgi:uncharacterized protein YcbK (DUF882 family)
MGRRLDYVFNLFSRTVHAPYTTQALSTIKTLRALASPTSSERFFEAGRQQLEKEIQRLQQGSNAQTSDILKIDPAIFQQLRNLQQQEQHFLDGVPEKCQLHRPVR